MCERCATGQESFDYKPEHPEWVYHLLNHYSWEEWRVNNPEKVEEFKKFPAVKPEHWSNDPSEDE